MGSLGVVSLQDQPIAQGPSATSSVQHPQCTHLSKTKPIDILGCGPVPWISLKPSTQRRTCKRGTRGCSQRPASTTRRSATG